MSNADAPSRRSSRRRISQDGSTASRPVSTHPYSPSIDATTVPPMLLAEEVRISSRHSIFLAQLDFVHTPDAKLQSLFYDASRHEDRSFDVTGKIVLPPSAYRRTAKQIRTFFLLGLGDKQKIIKKYSEYEVNTEGVIKYIESEYCKAEEKSKEPTENSTEVLLEDEADATSLQEESTNCPGITISYLSDMKLDAEKRSSRVLAFKHTIREGFTTRTILEHPDRTEPWPFCLPIVGALTCGNDSNKIVWKIEEVEGISIVKSYNEGSDFERYIIRHVDCLGESVFKQGLCEHCFTKKLQLMKRLDSTIKVRNENVNINSRITLSRTFSLQQERTNYYAKKAKNATQRASYYKRALDKLTKEQGMQVELNDSSDSIFNTSVAENVSRFLNSDPNDRSNALADYIFRESVAKHQQAKRNGAKSVRHSPLVIRLGALILKKMGNGGDLYDLVAKAMGLPSSRQIRRYNSHSVNEPDGVLYSQLQAAYEEFELEHPGLPMHDFLRLCIMSFDEMSVKGRFSVNHHTNALMAIANDAFEQSVIEREWQALAANEDNDGEIEVPEPTKYFLAFFLTPLHAGAKKNIFFARYGVKKTKYEFLARRLQELPAIAFTYGFIACILGNDGANENRTVSKYTANITARDILTDKLPREWLLGLSLDVSIAYRHPSPACQDILIFFASDMPHLVKKIRNAFENLSRELTFRGKLMNLTMIKVIWLAFESKGASLRKTKFGWDHFELDSYKKMRVFLAVQITSYSTIDMITEHCAREDNEDKIEDYAGMIELFAKIDRLVDICNAKSEDEVTKSGRKRDVNKIDSPMHRHVKELLDILRTFEEWKIEAGGFTKKFITKQTYEDLCWLILGTVGAAVTYLDEDGSKTMDQGKLGSDVCEHFFGMVREDNSNPTYGQAAQAASKISATNAVVQSNMFRTKRGGSNTVGVGVDAEKYVAPLPKAKKRKTN